MIMCTYAQWTTFQIHKNTDGSFSEYIFTIKIMSIRMNGSKDSMLYLKEQLPCKVLHPFVNNVFHSPTSKHMMKRKMFSFRLYAEAK
jgi:hypothetical protein